MPFQVTTFCTYRTTRKGPWSDRDYAASKFIKALKERPVSGWAYVPVGKEHVRLDAANVADAPDIFARQATCGVKWDELGPLACHRPPHRGTRISAVSVKLSRRGVRNPGSESLSAASRPLLARSLRYTRMRPRIPVIIREWLNAGEGICIVPRSSSRASLVYARDPADHPVARTSPTDRSESLSHCPRPRAISHRD